MAEKAEGARQQRVEQKQGWSKAAEGGPEARVEQGSWGGAEAREGAVAKGVGKRVVKIEEFGAAKMEERIGL